MKTVVYGIHHENTPVNPNWYNNLQGIDEVIVGDFSPDNNTALDFLADKELYPNVTVTKYYMSPFSFEHAKNMTMARVSPMSLSFNLDLNESVVDETFVDYLAALPPITSLYRVYLQCEDVVFQTNKGHRGIVYWDYSISEALKTGAGNVDVTSTPLKIERIPLKNFGWIHDVARFNNSRNGGNKNGYMILEKFKYGILAKRSSLQPADVMFGNVNSLPLIAEVMFVNGVLTKLNTGEYGEQYEAAKLLLHPNRLANLALFEKWVLT